MKILSSRKTFLLITFVIGFILFKINTTSDIFLLIILSSVFSMIVGNSLFFVFIEQLSFSQAFWRNFKFFILAIVLLVISAFIENVTILLKSEGLYFVNAKFISNWFGSFIKWRKKNRNDLWEKTEITRRWKSI